ncbi:S8 family peptidase [Hymenobacter sp. BT175]|uniref:S8 family peptidase n=1 Tax=Hymenobacter translucens TaxID=2886507 RepID=UPI001D0E401A|nr:S8 family peptidase [Hymenobacter translucens]MCC2548148.1 S8 family peptidase [Hymenobacter translucens]
MTLVFRPWPTLLLTAVLLPAAGLAQSTTAPPPVAAPQWHLLDPLTSPVQGISADRTYQELLAGRASAQVVVAVIDAGIDSVHQDLKRVLWKNTRELVGNGQDDDRNGYADDVHGWSFLGGKDGRNVDVDTYEDTRLMARLKPLYAGKTRAKLKPAQQKEYDLYKKVEKTYQQKLTEATTNYQQYSALYGQYGAGFDKIKQALGVPSLDTATLRRVRATDPELQNTATGLYENLKAGGFASTDALVAELKEYVDDLKSQLDYSLNLNFNPRPIVGDNYANVKERAYGNADMHGPDPSHGTHVAGIIGADRTNTLGVRGIADNVLLMAVRAVPNGDERDKDIANAIRYAVDNGAQIINMSFGKYYSPQRVAVEDAIRYAASKNVLLIHSAGNESKDLDVETQYISPRYLNGTVIPNMITVGASAAEANERLAADFSNYGKKSVDVFAPGVQIYSTLPGSTYGNKSGTSMAGPVVAGMAAVLKSYYPQLTAIDLKRIILQSAVPNHTQVLRPGTKKTVDFAQLSSTGAIVNLYQAVLLAQKEAK